MDGFRLGDEVAELHALALLDAVEDSVHVALPEPDHRIGERDARHHSGLDVEAEEHGVRARLRLVHLRTRRRAEAKSRNEISGLNGVETGEEGSHLRYRVHTTYSDADSGLFPFGGHKVRVVDRLHVVLVPVLGEEHDVEAVLRPVGLNVALIFGGREEEALLQRRIEHWREVLEAARLAIEPAPDDKVVRLDLCSGGDNLELLGRFGLRVVLVQAEMLDGSKREGRQRA